MRRWLFGSVACWRCAVLAVAADKDKSDKGKPGKDDQEAGQKEAKITEVDAKKGTVTVR